MHKKIEPNPSSSSSIPSKMPNSIAIPPEMPLTASPIVQAKDDLPPPSPYQFDPNDEFYLAPPTCQFLHYRDAAIFVGILEILLLIGAFVTSLDLFVSKHLVGIWAPLLVSAILCIAVGTTVTMIYGIRNEQPQMLWPQIYFLRVEITFLMAGAVFSIASMCAGIEATNWIFSHFVNISVMERQFGPIWPFNVAIVSFSGAALGIWFDVIVRGCLDYLLDKEYFALAPQPIQIGECFRSSDRDREERRMG